MNKQEIIISVMPEETRLAICENGQLVYIEAQRPGQSTLVDNIYLGRVQSVLPGMGAVFVDIGTEKNAFLYVGDEAQKPHVGQKILLQITKDATGTKGPRGTMRYALPGHYAVLLPTAPSVGISRRIDDEAERQRLKELAIRLCPPHMGIIFRTAAREVGENILEQDLKKLIAWQEMIARQATNLSAPALLYNDTDILHRLVRDFLTTNTDSVVFDDANAFKAVREALEQSLPAFVPRLKLYDGAEAIFAHYHLEEAIANSQKRKVELKSGGFIVIDKTEALTVIDVNTGKYIGSENLSETIYRTNMEAAAEILRQLKLRDIGGIIIVDFIDMERTSQKEELLTFMRERAKNDRAKTNVAGLTSLGLVEITRKKSRQNFDSLIHVTCPHCHGSGEILSPETLKVLIGRKIREAERQHHATDGYIVEVHPKIGNMLITDDYANRLAKSVGVEIDLIDNPDLPLDRFTLMGKS